MYYAEPEGRVQGRGGWEGGESRDINRRELKQLEWNLYLRKGYGGEICGCVLVCVGGRCSKIRMESKGRENVLWVGRRRHMKSGESQRG